MKTSITKILDIDSKQVPASLISSLETCECYRDCKETQDIYNSFDLLTNSDFDEVFKEEERVFLDKVETLCVEQECDYFRITY